MSHISFQDILYIQSDGTKWQMYGINGKLYPFCYKDLFCFASQLILSNFIPFPHSYSHNKGRLKKKKWHQMIAGTLDIRLPDTLLIWALAGVIGEEGRESNSFETGTEKINLLQSLFVLIMLRLTKQKIINSVDY